MPQRHDAEDEHHRCRVPQRDLHCARLLRQYLYMHLSWRLLRPFPQAGSGFTSFCRHLESPFFFLFVSSCLHPSSWQVGHSSVFYGHGEAIWIVMLARVPPFGLIFTPIFFLLEIEVFFFVRMQAAHILSMGREKYALELGWRAWNESA